MNVDLLIKENKELSEEKQRYKNMWFTTNNSLAKYKKLEEQVGCPLEVAAWLLQGKPILVLNPIDETLQEIKHPLNFYDSTRQAFDIRNELFETTHVKRIWTTGGVIVPLKDYKKTWWLKEDRSE